MKLNFHSRTWHIWVSLILSLPILIVAATAVFIAHKKAIGTEEINVAANWLPGYRSAAAKLGRNEMRASLTTAGGETWVATNSGLYRLDGEQLVATEALAGTQVRALAEAPWGRIAAAKNGIWLEKDGQWQRVQKGDAWSAASQPNGSIVVALKDKGLLWSSDGQHWQTDARLVAALASLPADTTEPLTLGKLIIDLHTGKAFFGKDGEWIWVDLVGLAISLLALTGVYMWWRGQRRKAALTGI
jgi:hypothetical protein